MGNKILVKNGDKAILKEKCNCSYPTIAAALEGKEKTATHVLIRNEALALGGVEVVPAKEKELEIH